ncbi:MAG TPA: phosphohydrolase [Puia sp.]|nr:phosphohydrolase [Puia sp.]
MQPIDEVHWEEKFIDYLRLNLTYKDASHDLGHFQRVWKAAQAINREEGFIADPLILLAAAYFHDLVSLPKNHPDRSQSSRLSAEKTVELLEGVFEGFPSGKIEGVRHAIHAHSFSAGVEPVTAEAKILQDADRLEALGAIGLARVFYTAGQLGQQLFDERDPLASSRDLDDGVYALDHFSVKLLKLPARMNTSTGRRLAEENAAYLLRFMKKISAEIGGDYATRGGITDEPF